MCNAAIYSLLNFPREGWRKLVVDENDKNLKLVKTDSNTSFITFQTFQTIFIVPVIYVSYISFFSLNFTLLCINKTLSDCCFLIFVDFLPNSMNSRSNYFVRSVPTSYRPCIIILLFYLYTSAHIHVQYKWRINKFKNSR